MWRHAHYSAAEHVDTQIHTLTTAIISKGQCSSGPRHITIEDPSYPQINRTKKSVHRPKAFLATTKKGWPQWVEALIITSLLTIPSNGFSFYFQFTLVANSTLFVGIITCTKKKDQAIHPSSHLIFDTKSQSFKSSNRPSIRLKQKKTDRDASHNLPLPPYHPHLPHQGPGPNHHLHTATTSKPRPQPHHLSSHIRLLSRNLPNLLYFLFRNRSCRECLRPSHFRR